MFCTMKFYQRKIIDMQTLRRNKKKYLEFDGESNLLNDASEFACLNEDIKVRFGI